MKTEEMRELVDGDIASRIFQLEEERFRLRFRSATETLEDPLRLRSIRREIARLHTVKRERELGTVHTAGKSPAAAKGAAAKSKAKKGSKARSR